MQLQQLPRNKNMGHTSSVIDHTDSAVATADPDDTPVSPVRVLVVEDSTDAALSLDMLLTIGGYNVQVRRTGQEGLDAIFAFHPHIAILDIGLPGLNGWEIATRVTEKLGDRKPVMIAVTGYGQEEDRRRSQEAGFTYHFVKPVPPVKLLSLLHTIAARLHAQEEAASSSQEEVDPSH
jgi:DNA-binding response OmpR family regulator